MRNIRLIVPTVMALVLIGYSGYRAITHPVVKASSNISVEQSATSSASPQINLKDIRPSPESKPEEPLTDTVVVTRVVDGDTIEIEGGQKVRYIGVNTPESVDPRQPVQCFGVEASNANKSLVEGKRVRLESDISETDKYSRLLRYVWIGGVMVNDVLVRQGFAQVSTYPPDVKYQSDFLSAQNEAREAGRGLWANCDSPTSNITQPSAKSTQAPPDPNCVIKGNISSSGKIYHMPGQRYYDQTTIDESSGERWFCNEVEAQAAGWRKSKL